MDKFLTEKQWERICFGLLEGVVEQALEIVGIILSWKIKLVRVRPVVTCFTISRTLEQGATKLVSRWQYIADKLQEDLLFRIIIQDVGKGNQKTVQASFNSLFLGGVDRLTPLMNESFPELGLQSRDCIEMSWIQSVLYFAGYQKEDPIEVLLERTTPYKSFFKAKSDFVRISQTRSWAGRHMGKVSGRRTSVHDHGSFWWTDE